MFLYSAWLKLPLVTRQEVASKFGISKTGPTHVADNRVVSDGYKVEDVEGALNIDAIQKFTGSESTDMTELWDAMMAKIEGREAILVPRIIVDEEAPVVSVTVNGSTSPSTFTVESSRPKKRGRPAKYK